MNKCFIKGIVKLPRKHLVFLCHGDLTCWIYRICLLSRPRCTMGSSDSESASPGGEIVFFNCVLCPSQRSAGPQGGGNENKQRPARITWESSPQHNSQRPYGITSAHPDVFVFSRTRMRAKVIAQQRKHRALPLLAQVSQSRDAVPRCTERCRSERSAVLSEAEMPRRCPERSAVLRCT